MNKMIFCWKNRKNRKLLFENNIYTENIYVPESITIQPIFCSVHININQEFVPEP